MNNNTEKDINANNASEEALDENIVVNDDFAAESEDTQAQQEVNTLENQLAELQNEVEKQKRNTSSLPLSLTITANAHSRKRRR